MPLNDFKNCATCPHKDREILIVGTQRFTAEILAHFIGTNTPANWKIVENFKTVSAPNDQYDSAWRLIFLECQGRSDNSLLKLLQTEATHLLEKDVIALFNLTRNNTVHLELITLGVRGFFYENDQAEILLKGICALNRGEMWVSRDTLMEYINQQPKTSPPQHHPTIRLTRREKDILSLIASGATNETIASSLYISSDTVKSHNYHIFKKIGVSNRMGAAIWALQNLK